MTPGGRYEGLDCRTLYSRKSKPTPQRCEGWHTGVLAAIGTSLPRGGSVKACRPSPNPASGPQYRRHSAEVIFVKSHGLHSGRYCPIPISQTKKLLTMRFDPPGVSESEITVGSGYLLRIPQ